MENLPPQDELRLDNEILKLKLQPENQAAQIHIAPGLDPEVENKWLNYVYNYEKVCKEAPKRSVYEMMGKPEFKNASDLSDEEIEQELTSLFKIMMTSKVRLNWLDDCYDDRTLYVFITEELFNEMVD